MFQHNKSTILLEENAKRSSGKRNQAINVRYFLITNQVETDNLKIKYCPTDMMISDYMTKGLQGMMFSKIEKEIMGIKK